MGEGKEEWRGRCSLVIIIIILAQAAHAISGGGKTAIVLFPVISIYITTIRSKFPYSATLLPGRTTFHRGAWTRPLHYMGVCRPVNNDTECSIFYAPILVFVSSPVNRPVP